MAKGGKQSIRRLESQSCFLRARWQLFLLLKLAAGWAWAALPRWHLSCKPMHAAEGCPQDSECACVPACQGMHHHSKSQRLFQCKFMCPHKAECELLMTDVQKATTRASLAVKSSSKNLWQGMWSPLGAGTFLYVCPWQPRHTTELLQKPTCSPSFHKSSRWEYLHSKHFPLNWFYTQFSRLHLLIYFLSQWQIMMKSKPTI